jgi:hypothetical protein
MRPARLVTALGIALFVAAVYIASAPGRIDIIDGQYRFEVARNMVEDYSIQLRDMYLGNAIDGVLGAYSPYGVSGSLTGVPLIVLADLVGPASMDRRMFFFSFTSGVLGALTAGVLFFFLTELSVAPRPALAWTLVASFATLAFPVATSTFDQTQHGFFILCACLGAYMSARHDSNGWAVVAGAALAFLVNFQITYVILIPTLAVAALAAPSASAAERRRGFERAALVVFGGAAGVLIWAGINKFRFDTFVGGVEMNVRHPPARGNPLIGLPALLVSPGKSLFLYSPPTIAALIGLRGLFKREPRLVQAVAATCLVHLAMVSSLTFYGGDWCWGPRYFVSVLPLIALGFGFLDLTRRSMRVLLPTLVTLGLVVQALALTVDHHRFFYGNSLPTFFWYQQPGYYFSHSALFERPAEVAESLRVGVPREAVEFRPGPYPEFLSYAVFGGWGHPGLAPPAWMRYYQVFWLPRPWPLWLPRVSGAKPVSTSRALLTVSVMALAGLLCMSIVRGGAPDPTT